MNSHSPGQQPVYPVHTKRPWSYFVPFAIGALALVGLATTALPAWSLSGQASDFGYDKDVITQLESGGVAFSTEPLNGMATVHLGLYDWIVSAAPMAAMVPIVFTLALSTSIVQFLSGNDHRLWGSLSAIGVCALVVVIITSLRPVTYYDVSGPLAREMSLSDSSAVLGESSPLEGGIGAGLVIALAALLAVSCLAGWQYVMTSRRPTPTSMP